MLVVMMYVVGLSKRLLCCCLVWRHQKEAIYVEFMGCLRVFVLALLLLSGQLSVRLSLLGFVIVL